MLSAISGSIRSVASAWLRLRFYVQAQPLSLLSENEKREHIKFWQRTTGYRVFVETGTFLGKTTLAMAPLVDRCYTIEIDPSLYQRALTQFKNHPNIVALLGDSQDKLNEILSALNEPAIFWLDGHCSGGVTGGDRAQAPIEAELLAILRHPVKEHVILIDDARLFVGREGYPSLSRFHRLVNQHSSYSLRVFGDIIRVYRDDL